MEKNEQNSGKKIPHLFRHGILPFFLFGNYTLIFNTNLLRFEG